MHGNYSHGNYSHYHGYPHGDGYGYWPRRYGYGYGEPIEFDQVSRTHCLPALGYGVSNKQQHDV